MPAPGKTSLDQRDAARRAASDRAAWPFGGCRAVAGPSS
ncbi:hypothetical protein L493_1469 [Bordetella bronchiseptica 99-R-0433]|nr:hypothetical protein L493_1469 [Bordetella bronchiseptica 99-R-0433]